MVPELGLDLERVQANVRKADMEDLLDRATVYRNGMEPDALHEQMRRAWNEAHGKQTVDN